MSLSREDVAGTIAPLSFIFWGGLLCILDFTISSKVNGEGFKVDLLNDFVGMLLITYGIFKLSAVQVHDRYSSAMGFVKIVAVLATLKALHDHLIYRTPEMLSVLFALLGLAELIAVVVFCVATRWFSREAQMENSARSWTTTIWLVTLIYLIPLGFFYAAGAVALSSDAQTAPAPPIACAQRAASSSPIDPASPQMRLASPKQSRPASATRPGPKRRAALAAGSAASASTRLNATSTQVTAVTETSSSR